MRKISGDFSGRLLWVNKSHTIASAAVTSKSALNDPSPMFFTPRTTPVKFLLTLISSSISAPPQNRAFAWRFCNPVRDPAFHTPESFHMNHLAHASTAPHFFAAPLLTTNTTSQCLQLFNHTAKAHLHDSQPAQNQSLRANSSDWLSLTLNTRPLLVMERDKENPTCRAA